MPITIDLSKVQWIKFYWSNGAGVVRDTKPKGLSVDGTLILSDEFAGYHPDYPGETCLERARRLDKLDHWTPMIRVVFTANKHLTFTGIRAQAIWKEWNRRQYGKAK